jgi:AraC-like DNA-binding protein
MLSVMIFFDIMIKFKRNLPLKLSILGIVISTLIISVGYLYSNIYGYDIYLIKTGTPLFILSLFNFFWILYKVNFSKKLLIAEVFFIIPLLIYLIMVVVNEKEHLFPILDKLKDYSFEKNMIKNIIGMIFLFFILYFIFKIIKKFSEENIYYEQVKIWATWLIFSITITVFSVFILSNFQLNYIYQRIGLSISQFFSLLLILFRPSILNKGDIKSILGKKRNYAAKVSFDNNLFCNIFYFDLFFLKKNASAEELATLLNTTTEEVQTYVTNKYDMNLTDLINKNRVKYFIDLLTNGKFNDENLETLSQKAGFNSRHHLLKPFKKFHGGNPSDFIKAVSKN